MLDTRRTVVGRYWKRRLGGRMETRRQSWVLAPDAFRRMIEDRIRDRFGMTLPEFAEAFRAGKLDDDPAAYDLAVSSGASAR